MSSEPVRSRKKLIELVHDS